MSLHSVNEIIGDWNNLKGTHYHLVFALWLILRRQVSSVEFYQGNDLLAHSFAELDDLWIQLKATKSKWTRSKLFEENLLLNFIYNAVESNKRGRKWKARLVSQGEVDKVEILEFIAAPNKFPELNKSFNQIIDKASDKINKDASSLFIPRAEIVKIALVVLGQIAEEEPIPLEVLQAQIESELALAFPTRETVNRIGNLLLGAMIEDSAAGPEIARVYDAEWINKIAQRSVIRFDLLDENVVAACDAATQRTAALVGYKSDRVVNREAFGVSFSHYLKSEQTCYVLLGTNGSGKSWAIADAAVSQLKNTARLMIRSIDFDSGKRLEDLVAGELKRHSSSNWSNAQYLQKLTSIPREENQPQFIIILDDLIPLGDVESYRQNLGRLLRDCKNIGAKLVITCQQHVWNFLRSCLKTQKGFNRRSIKRIIAI